MEIQHAL
jgi:hypothetical protein